jgi:hypothetical protein
VAREAALKLDQAQGFGERLTALEVTWREAEAARQGQGWGQALSGYDAVLAACKRLEEEEVSRGDARTRRGEAEKAEEAAVRAEAAKDAKEIFEEGVRCAARAAQAFEKGLFADASKAWRETAAAYASAQGRALAVQAYTTAKVNFETVLATNTVLLTTYGGAKWADVKSQQKLAEIGTNDPSAGADAYRKALAALPGAVEEAQAAERAAKLATALAAARQAKAAGDWQACLGRACGALALEADHAEALALKSEAEKNLMPVLKIMTEAGGREVDAQISEGGLTYTAPHAFLLKPDASYSFVVSYSDDARRSTPHARYKPATFDVTADWQGPKTRRVALKEMTGPPEGEAWTSPATGMEFVWVVALKLWVGKYEVTNGEYRKKEPDHDSKDYKDNTLNGERQPVVYVNFDDAKAYAEWLTERDKDRLDGMRYRVISEQEWQTCAQCGDGREYPWGSEMPPKCGNYSDSASPFMGKINGYTDGFAVTCPVERSAANEWGFYGIGGNVWECCAADVSGSSFGAWRGASWRSLEPDALHCACRDGGDGSYRDIHGGFRLALDSREVQGDNENDTHMLSAGIWRSDLAKAYNLGVSKGRPVVLFLYASSLRCDENKTVESCFKGERVGDVLNRFYIRVKTDIESQELSPDDRALLKRIFTDNHLDDFPRVLLLIGNTVADEVWDASVCKDGGEMLSKKLRMYAKHE